MLKLSKRVEYGLIALLHMDSCRTGSPLPAKDISERFDIPPELLGKVLQSLARANLVSSTKGAHGGYGLARPLERINVGEVIEALDGPIHITPCCDETTTCRRDAACNIRRPIQRVQEHVVGYVKGLSLNEFRQSALETGPVIATASPFESEDES